MRIKLGELLVQHQVVTQEQVDEALRTQKQFGGKLGTNLVELGFVSDEKLAQILSKQLNLPSVRAVDFEKIPPQLIAMIPKQEVEKHKIIPIRLDKRLTLAICDPQTTQLLDELGFKLGKSIQPVIAPEIWVIAAMERYYKIPREARYIQLEDAGTAFSLPGPSIQGEFVLDQPKIVVFQSFVNQLLKANSKEDVIQELLEFLHNYFTRTAVYVLRKDLVCGWMLRGFPIHVKEFQKIEIPLSSPNQFSAVISTNQSFVGTLGELPENKKFAVPLQIGPKQKVELHPITFHGKGVIVVLGIADEGDKLEDRKDLLDLALRKSSQTLELLAIKKQIAEMPAN